jgi:hypothetical protein
LPLFSTGSFDGHCARQLHARGHQQLLPCGVQQLRNRRLAGLQGKSSATFTTAHGKVQATSRAVHNTKNNDVYIVHMMAHVA